MKKFLITYLPHTHLMFFGVLALVLAIMILIYFKSFIKAIREVHSEKMPDGSAGKLSHKRVGLTIIILGMVYGFIYAIHSSKSIDPYAFTVLGVIVVLGWKLATPTDAEGLIDKLGNFKKGLLKPDDTTPITQTTTTVNVNP